MSTTTTFEITRVPVPASLDAPDAADLHDWAHLWNSIAAHDAGHNALDESEEELLGAWQATDDWLQIPFLARDGETAIAVAIARIATEEGLKTAEFDILVQPAYRGSGVEELLIAEVERIGREHGRTTMQGWTLHRPEAPEHELRPPSGWGVVPADDPQTQYMLRNGYTLGQVERNSVFDLHADPAPLQRKFDDAVAFAGSDYRYIEWTSPTPPELVDRFAAIISRMSTDVPAGDLELEEQHWDAARVQRRDARLASMGLHVSVSAVVHVPSGDLVAYNELVIGEDTSGATTQYGTLVMKEHRGHHLGMVVKCGNILRWRGMFPDSPRISTFNAEENRPMLDINEAVGFVPISYAGGWKKELV